MQVETGQAGIDGFQSRKELCLSKRDRSSAGRIDPRAVEICAAINEREEYYTTSSCAGRCFLYSGDGIKAHHHFARDAENYFNATRDDAKDQQQERQDHDAAEIAPAEPSGLGFFHRFRVNHDIIRDEIRYFDLTTLDPDREDFDPSGGGDPVRSVAQYDYKQQNLQQHSNDDDHHDDDDNEDEDGDDDVDENDKTSISRGPYYKVILQQNNPEKFKCIPQQPIWLRFEPFILHVMCRSLFAAQALMNAARPAFKNVGLTSWKHGFGRYIVAIWGEYECRRVYECL
jgi:tRNA(Phe) wybutosine-synthesizing methylase Tyw3